MWNKEINISLAAIVVFASTGSLVDANAVEISAVNTPADLDLSGDILYPINFGDNGNPNVGGIVFSQDQECPDITLDALGEGPATWWGPYPGTADAGLNELLNGLAYRWGTPPNQISIGVGGVITGKSYLL